MTTRVLIADDNAKVREAWQQLLLTIPNVEVVAVASDGEEAVSLAMHYRPSVVLMDISMPRLDGFEATRRIRRNAPEVRVIIVSAETSAAFVERAFEVGADGYVAKAAAADQLAGALRAVANGERFKNPLGDPNCEDASARSADHIRLRR
jgi:DNA-binding NarL/FixJ family response regulator